MDVANLAADPRQVWTTLVDQYVYRRERRGPACDYKSDESWEQQLHAHLGAPWPCPFASEFWKLWSDVIGELEGQGVRPGPESFLSWNDGDAGLVRTIWCLTRHLRPNKVIETGVAHGVTSRFILEALYSRVAPVSWIISKHVSEGREILDFSEWANQPHSADERMLICDAVSDGRMPLPEYTAIHRNAKLSKRDVELICGWAAAPSVHMTSPQVSKSTNQTK